MVQREQEKLHLSYAILNEINQKTDTFSYAIFVPEFVPKNKRLLFSRRC